MSHEPWLSLGKKNIIFGETDEDGERGRYTRVVQPITNEYPMQCLGFGKNDALPTHWTKIPDGGTILVHPFFLRRSNLLIENCPQHSKKRITNWRSGDFAKW